MLSNNRDFHDGDSDEGTFDWADRTGRRSLLRNTVIAAVAGCSVLPGAFVTPAIAADELPSGLREYTRLAPLGPKGSRPRGNENGAVAAGKTTGLSPEEMARRLSIDLSRGAHGKGGYFLTGDLSTDLFRDDCVFEDPTTRVDSLSQYKKALSLLFDPDRSTVELLGDGLSVVSRDGPTVITGRLRSRGFLRVAPWNPYVKAYETTITYTLDPDTGLVARQDQVWTKDASEALKETFTPSFNGAPPKSARPKPTDEPEAVTALFEVLNGRRPSEYSREERGEIDARIEQVTTLARPSAGAPGLSGTWVLVYLQPGPDGAGIDRRIPFFPEFEFNDSFQVFSSIRDGSEETSGGGAGVDRVTNVGQVLGSWADVRVSGSLREVSATKPPLPDQQQPPRRFEASIDGGKLCVNGGSIPRPSDGVSCPIDLPMIRGTGIFDSIYLGDRLRIGKNINGGGARVVQVRL